MRVLVLSIAVFARGVISQQTGWGQCGGQGWAGTSTCPSGWTCTYSNPWYSQCLPRGSTSSTITSSTIASRPTSTSSTSQLPSTPTGVGKFKWLGVNEGGAEFGQDTYPRTWGRHFIFPDTSAVGVRLALISPRGFFLTQLTLTNLDADFDLGRLQYIPYPLRHGTHGPKWRVLFP